MRERERERDILLTSGKEFNNVVWKHSSTGKSSTLKVAQAPPTVQFFKEAKPGGSTHATKLRSVDIKLAQLTLAAPYITIIVPKYKGHSSFPFPLGIKKITLEIFLPKYN